MPHKLTVAFLTMVVVGARSTSLRPTAASTSMATAGPVPTTIPLPATTVIPTTVPPLPTTTTTADIDALVAYIASL